MVKHMECPNGCNAGFHVTAHVTQDWAVDARGNFETCLNDCIEVTHSPDFEDVWACAKCGAQGKAVEDKEDPLKSSGPDPTYRVMFYITTKPGTDMDSLKRSLSVALPGEINLEFPEIEFCSSCEIEKE